MRTKNVSRESVSGQSDTGRSAATTQFMRSLGVLFVVAVSGCSGSVDGLEVESRDCPADGCSFLGDSAAGRMLNDGQRETGEWNGWSSAIRGQLEGTDLEGDTGCESDAVTATVASADLRTSESDEPGLTVSLTIAFWRDAEVACLGTLDVEVREITLEVLGTAVPGLGSFVEVSAPEVGAGIAL